MADSHYATFEAAWVTISAHKAVSCVKDGRHLFSFRLRAQGPLTPPTLAVLIETRYLDAAWLKPNAMRLEPLPAKFRQAPREGFERRELFRLFDEYLLQEALPPNYLLAPRTIFEDRYERAYEITHPDLYAHMVAVKNTTCLGRIRNCGSLSAAQEMAVRAHMARKAAKTDKDAKEQRRKEREAEEEERRQRLARYKALNLDDD